MQNCTIYLSWSFVMLLFLVDEVYHLYISQREARVHLCLHCFQVGIPCLLSRGRRLCLCGEPGSVTGQDPVALLPPGAPLGTA